MITRDDLLKYGLILALFKIRYLGLKL